MGASVGARGGECMIWVAGSMQHAWGAHGVNWH